MKSDLRKNPLRSMGRYWLTMSDGSAFTLVRSAIAVAEALRRDLAEKARLVPKPGTADLAVMLLTAAESGWGKGKASQLVAQIVNLNGAAPYFKGRAYLLVRDALAQLPLTLWTQDKLSARRELLEELTRQINLFQADMPSHPTWEEIREQQWRDSIAAMRKSESEQRLRG